MKLAEAPVPTRHGLFAFVVFEREHVALVRGDVRGDDVVVRVHAECVGSETFGATSCTCARDLDRALEEVAAADRGVVVYLRRERGVAWLGACERSALARFDDAEPILAELGVRSMSR